LTAEEKAEGEGRKGMKTPSNLANIEYPLPASYESIHRINASKSFKKDYLLSKNQSTNYLLRINAIISTCLNRFEIK